MPGGMNVFDHDYHFPNTHSREGTVSAKKKTLTKATKGSTGRGYGGPKALKGHSEKHEGGRMAKSVKSTGNEFRKPKDHKDIPTKAMATSASGKSTAPKGVPSITNPKSASPAVKGVLQDSPSAVAQHRVRISSSRQAFTKPEATNYGEE